MWWFLAGLFFGNIMGILILGLFAGKRRDTIDTEAQDLYDYEQMRRADERKDA